MRVGHVAVAELGAYAKASGANVACFAFFRKVISTHQLRQMLLTLHLVDCCSVRVRNAPFGKASSTPPGTPWSKSVGLLCCSSVESAGSTVPATQNLTTSLAAASSDLEGSMEMLVEPGSRLLPQPQLRSNCSLFAVDSTSKRGELGIVSGLQLRKASLVRRTCRRIHILETLGHHGWQGV